MLRKSINSLTIAVATSLMVTSLALAAGAGITGTVASIDKKGMATIKAEDGKEYHVKGKGLQAGDAVECAMKGKSMSCMKKPV